MDIRCPTCAHENRGDRQYCGACGEQLSKYCPECGFANERPDRYCGGCGRALEVSRGRPRPPARRPAGPPPLPRPRRGKRSGGNNEVLDLSLMFGARPPIDDDVPPLTSVELDEVEGIFEL